jgi:hypothetical protein
MQGPNLAQNISQRLTVRIGSKSIVSQHHIAAALAPKQFVEDLNQYVWMELMVVEKQCLRREDDCVVVKWDLKRCNE